jgi:hypothetical protein
MQCSKILTPSHAGFLNHPLPLQTLGSAFPNGPTSVEELFGWAGYNAETLLAHPDLRKKFIRLIGNCDSIELHESYAGVGTAGVTLADQFSHMKNLVAGELPTGFLAEI